MSDTLRKWKVSVIAEEGNRKRHYTVWASTSIDAMQIALAVDGGWKEKERDTSGLSDLAKCYCEAKETQ